MLLREHIAGVRPAEAWRPVGIVAPWVACALAALAVHYGAPYLVNEYWGNVLKRVGVFVIAAVSLNIVNGYTGQFSMGHAGFMAVGGYVAAAVTYYGSLGLHGPVGDPAFYASGVGLMLVGVLAGACVAAAFGYLVGLPSLRLRGDYLAIVTLGFGEIIRVVLELTRPQVNAGVLNGVRDIAGDRGASVIRALVELPSPSAEGVERVLGAPLPPGSVQQLLSLLGSADAAGVRAFWEAPLSTLARVPLNGATSFFGVPTYATLFWVWLFVGLTCVIAYRVKISSSGRALLSIREDEVAARAMGINLTFNKVRAFVLAAFFGGIAGALLAHTGANPSPTDAGFQRSFDIIIFVVLGGLGSLSGAALAAVVLTVMSEVLRGAEEFINAWWLSVLIGGALAGVAIGVRRAGRRGAGVILAMAATPIALVLLALLAQQFYAWTGTKLSDYRMIIYSLLLIGMMLLRPQGLLGVREVWELFGPRARPRAPGAPRPSLPGRPA